MLPARRMTVAPMTPPLRTVDDYIAAQPAAVQAVLAAIRQAACAAAPEAEERLSYRMPALFQHGVLLYYGAFKTHIGLFPPVADPALQARVLRWAGPKGNLRLPLSEPMPLDMIAELVRARLRRNLASAAARRGGR